MGWGLSHARGGGRPRKVPAGVSEHWGLQGLWTHVLPCHYSLQAPLTAQTSPGLLGALSQSGPGTPPWVPSATQAATEAPGAQMSSSYVVTPAQLWPLLGWPCE